MNVADLFGRSSLYSYSIGDEDSVKLLLDAGADLTLWIWFVASFLLDSSFFSFFIIEHYIYFIIFFFQFGKLPLSIAIEKNTRVLSLC